MKTIIFVFALLSCSSVFAEVYQCANGSFSSKPCTSTRTAADLVKENKEKEQYKQALINKQQAEQREWESRAPKVGMTKAQAYNSNWGYPNKENVTTSAYGVREQWVYRSGANSKYLYFENGKLTQISE